jgi:hypothetical protein
MHAQRDILVLSKYKADQEEMQEELDVLNVLLHNAETLQSFCASHEVIDVNKYKIYQQPHIIQKYSKMLNKPFVFVCNKN